jgi:hypothetical protein
LGKFLNEVGWLTGAVAEQLEMQKQPVNREIFALLTAQRPVAAAAPDKNIISKEFRRINV